MNTKSVVYFEEVRIKDWVYLGFSGPGKHARQKAHASTGKRRLAAIAGTWEDEQAVHRDLDDFRVDKNDCGNDSTYQGPEVHDYIAWLVGRGYAHVEDAKAREAPMLPYDIWRFSNRQRPYEEYDGQIRLHKDLLPLAQRLKWEAEAGNKSSLSDDWYTPKEIIEMARDVMGAIDTDPANCVAANEWIQARIWYTREIDGLAAHNPWRGKVWLNPPYGRGEYSAKAFINRLEQEYLNRTVTEAITCLNSDSITSLWFDPVWRSATVHLVWRGRINFITPRKEQQNSSPEKGTIFSYFGLNCARFKKVFGPHGQLIVRLPNGQ